MFFSKKSQPVDETGKELRELQNFFIALNQAMVVVEFNTDGTLLRANDNFCTTMDYQPTEINGLHHSIFCETGYSKSAEYAQFWQRLRSGESFKGKFKRLVKNGRTVWLEATYFPVTDQSGSVCKVIKIASDITAQVQQAEHSQALLEALNRSMAVIEFDLDGIIRNANPSFLHVMGYRLDELKGTHHRQLCSSDYANSMLYKEFWEKLNRGEFFAGQVERIARNGRHVWLEATYNPIRNVEGQVYSVIKFAVDITSRIEQSNEMQASTRTAFEVSQLTEQLSVDGCHVILQAVDKMRALATDVRQSSQLVQDLGDKNGEITSIVNTIKEVADQTNLLALNAAIEAARAGEQGRGFAVVADEVRKLADRTARSTSEVSLMIDEIQSGTLTVINNMQHSLEAVEEGVNLAKEAGESIQKIREGARNVVNVVQKLSKISN